MPFTFSHPAIVLPFLKTRNKAISISALITGSIIPDFQYFILLKLNGRFSHSFPGIFLFDLPVAILVLIIFHAWIKEPFINNLPSYFSSRLQRLKAFKFFKYAKEHSVGLLLCLLLGIFSHIFWDAFTHKDGLFSVRIPILLTIAKVEGLPDMMIYRYLQHISTLIGAVFIFFAFHKMPIENVLTKPGLTYWAITAIFFTITLTAGLYSEPEYYAETIVIVISSGFVGIMVSSLIVRIKWNKT